ncbi:MAG: DUF885 domain-containing protein, partial [candidate division Zixibacteria bacterium]|nr:DUF885 domain-containing protein [candidate division Zixibacteria bacterium]
MNKEFNNLVDEALEFRWKDSPVSATFSGIHKYDDKLDKTDPESRRQHLKRTKEYLKRLDKFSSDSKIHTEKTRLSIDEKMDWKMLRNSLEVEIAWEEKLHWVQRYAPQYPETALFGSYILVLRDFAPLSQRMKSVLGRLKQVPR